VPPTETPAARSERAVPFTLVFNARDLGGIATADGRMVQKGRLYRADGVQRLSGDDLDAARALGLRTVIDLRTQGEVDRGRFPVEEIHVTWHNLPMIKRMWSEDSLVAADGDAVGFLRDRYVEMLDDGAASIAEIVALVADGTPALFHCAAGKDRTGVVAAVLLGLVGVSGDEIAHDYHLSAHAMAAFTEWIRENYPDAASAMTNQPAEYLGAPAEAMHGFLDHVDATYGSMHGLADHLGIDGATVARLQRALLD
jgi:protein-tyrosine phosphatase